MSTAASPRDRRLRRAAVRYGRHLIRIDALRAFVIAVVAFAVVVRTGADAPVGQGALVVIGTLVSYILLPDDPHRFWRVQASQLADTVPPSDLVTAGRETAKALALQTGGRVEPGNAATLWDDAVRRVTLGVSDPHRVVVNMDYRISVSREPTRQLVRTTISSKRCWPGAGRIFFSLCSDVSALGAEFAAPGSFLREIVKPEPGEDMDAWERRVATYPVTVVIDGRRLDVAERETRRLGPTSRAHRLVFDVTGNAVTERYTQTQITSEFHQAFVDRAFAVKFATYFCVGSTQLSIEIDDPTSTIDTNDFMLDPSLDTEFFHQYGLASHRVTIQTRSDAVLHPGSGVLFAWQPGDLLAEVPPALDNMLPEGEPLPSHPGLPTALVETEGRQEPLVPILAVRCLDAYHYLGLVDATRTLRAREEVVRRLTEAQGKLPTGFEIVVLDGWRSARLQSRLLGHYEAATGGSVDGYVADPDSATMRPPHVVGGALDLTLSFHGRPLALGSDYDELTPLAHLDAFEDTDSTVRRLRRLLARVLLEAGFSPYPLEWWHWSYGDDVWAAFVGKDALYDRIDESP